MPLEQNVAVERLFKYNEGHYINLLKNIDLFIKRADKEDIMKFFNIVYEIKKLDSGSKPTILNLMEGLTEMFLYMKKHKEIHIKADLYSEYLILDNIIKIYKTRRDFPSLIRDKIFSFLMNINSYQPQAPKQNEVAIEHFAMLSKKCSQLFQDLPIQQLLDNPVVITLLDNLKYEQLDSEQLHKKEVNVVHTLNRIKYLNSLTTSEEKELFEQVKSLEIKPYVNKNLNILNKLLTALENKDSIQLLNVLEDYVAHYLSKEKKPSNYKLSLHDLLTIFSSNYFEHEYNYTKGSLIQLLLKNYDKNTFFSFMEKYNLPFNMPLIHQSINVEALIETDSITKAHVIQGPSIHQYACNIKINLVQDLKDANINVWESFEYNAVCNNIFYNYKCLPLKPNETISFPTQADICYMIAHGTLDENVKYMNKYDDLEEHIFETLLNYDYYYAFIKLYNACKNKNVEFNIYRAINVLPDSRNIFDLYYKHTNTYLRHEQIYQILVQDYIDLSMDEKIKLDINPINNLYDLDASLSVDENTLMHNEVINEALLLEPFLTEALIGKVVIKEDFDLQEKQLETEKGEYLVEWYNKSKLSTHMVGATGRKVDIIQKIVNSCPDKKPLLRVNDEAFFADLEVNLPNFKEVINYYKGQFRQNRYGDKKRINPILLLGPPGIGKTYFSKKLAEYLKTGYSFIDMGGLSAGWVLSGNNGTWQDSKQGKILDIMMASNTFNPIVLLDEVDKVSGGTKYDSSVILHQLLEEVNAKEFIDEFVDFSFDMSGIIYIACANTAVTLSDPLLSRFKVFTIANPDYDQLDAIINNIYYEAVKDNCLLNNTLDVSLLNELKGNSLREVKVLVEEAITNALLEYSIDQLDKMKANHEMITLNKQHFKNKYERSKFGF